MDKGMRNILACERNGNNIVANKAGLKDERLQVMTTKCETSKNAGHDNGRAVFCCFYLRWDGKLFSSRENKTTDF